MLKERFVEAVSRTKKGRVSKEEAFWRALETLRQIPLRDEETNEVLEETIPQETLYRLFEDKRVAIFYDAGFEGKLKVELEGEKPFDVRDMIGKYLSKSPLSGKNIFVQSVRETLKDWDKPLTDYGFVDRYYSYYKKKEKEEKGKRVEDYLWALDEAGLTIQEKRIVWGYLFIAFFQELMWERVKPRLGRHASDKIQINVTAGQEEDYFLSILEPAAYFLGWAERIKKNSGELIQEVFRQDASEASSIIMKAISAVEKSKPSRPDIFLREVLGSVHKRKFEEAKKKLTEV